MFNSTQVSKIKILTTIQEMKTFRKSLNQESVGFVPTMGTLHEGHLELIKCSLKKNSVTVVSIFVNPMQFNNPKDYETYPNHLNADLELLEQLNVTAVFIPSKDQIYPNGYDYKLTENKNSIGLCGTSRPGHFDGVLTVLTKLFNLVKPENVYMGLKDYQQYLLVKNMVEDLFMDIHVEGVETVREESGLALSSRNLNLSPIQKRIADDYAKIFAANESLELIRTKLEKLDLKIDYLESRWGRKFVAVQIGNVRLIDNRPYHLAKISEDLKIAHLDSEKAQEHINIQYQRNIQGRKNVLFKMSGSIAAFKACDVISKLVQEGHNIKVAVTPDTSNFVGRATLEGLTGNKVFSDIYEAGGVMDHIHLNDWCDMTVLCPATANTLTKISLGLSDNVVTTLALSRDPKKPYLVVPAMNTRMLEAKPIQEAIIKLETMGMDFLFGKEGHLACGHTGSGRLAETKEIIEHIRKLLDKNALSLEQKFSSINETKQKNKKLNILVTAGATSEPIDPVRMVTNISSGQTGLKICQHLSDKFQVTLIGSSSLKDKITNLNSSIKYIEYLTFKDLELRLKETLENHNYDVVIHLAAVSDYSPDKLYYENQTIKLPTKDKISLGETKDFTQNAQTGSNLKSAESKSQFTIEFKKNKKLIDQIKSFSKNKDIKLIGFKLLRTEDLNKIQFEIDKILKSSDYVVVNDLKNISDKQHIYEIHNHEGLVFHGQSKNDLSSDLLKIIEGGPVL